MNELAKQPYNTDDEVEIDLLDLIAYYMSRLPLLIAALLVGAVVAGLVTYFLIPDKFTATSKMYMVSASSDQVVNLADLNLGTSLSNDYVELMKSRPVIEGVIENLELEYTYEQLLSMISLSVVNNTRIVKISVTSLDPQEAMDIANQEARVARLQLPKVMEAPMPSIVENAVYPERKSSPSMKKNILIGGLLCLLLILAILTVRYLMDDTIKTAEDVQKEFGVMPLSVIPEGEIAGLARHEREADDRKRRRGLISRLLRKGGRS